MIGKFKDEQQLLKAYEALEKEFTKRSQKLAELEDKDWYEGTIKQLEEQNERLIHERDTLVNFIKGQWIDAKLIQKLLQIDFSEGTSKFAFSRNAEWWSIAGKTEEEKSRNGQKITTQFKLDENKSARKVISDLEHFVVSNLTYVVYRGDDDFDDFIKQLKDKYGDYSL